jgi:short subunit dehydrogenase-like uncharacterized protein
MCQQTKVVVSTVGPYVLYGSTLVKVCAHTGTDYCDLTGEPQWIAQMIEQYEAIAQKNGARIVHCCGFDSIPSDLGTYYLQQQAQQQFGQACTRVKLRVKAIKGGMSGGTVGSMTEMIKEASHNAALRKLMANPYALCPLLPKANLSNLIYNLPNMMPMLRHGLHRLLWQALTPKLCIVVMPLVTTLTAKTLFMMKPC